MSIDPFSATPGRDTSSDPALPVDVAAAYYEQRNTVAEDRNLLLALIGAVGRESDLWPYQWAQWYSTTLSFKPDLVIELGRGNGNSTALFCQAASRLGAFRIESFDLNPGWVARPSLEKIVGPDWFKPLRLHGTDIRSVDFRALIGSAERILVLWDAHGFEIAEVVLGAIAPVVQQRAHLFLIHDISDNRYARIERGYSGPIWKGSRWQEASGEWDSRINIGWMNSIQDQVIALADFAARNDIRIGSADEAYHRFFDGQEGRQAEMAAALGPEFFSLAAHWAFMSLTGKAGPFHFPPPPEAPAKEGVNPTPSLIFRARRKLARLIAPVSLLP